MVYKIDLEKAYDHIEWSFLNSSLLDFGFPQNMVSFIMCCVTSFTLSLLWNGNKLPYFQRTKGLRQEKPLSPAALTFAWRSYS